MYSKSTVNVYLHMKRHLPTFSLRILCIFLISNLSIPLQACKLHNNDDKIFSKEQILHTYETNNLAEKPPFQGGYINFGYWKNIKTHVNKHNKISQEQRVQASLDLYKLVFNHLDINKNDNILEVGSGLGYGCKHLSENYVFNKLVCIDFTPEHINKAKEIHKNPSPLTSVQFKIADAEYLTTLNERFDKIYSVEAAQYFTSMDQFANEAFLNLNSQGKLILVAHFSTNDQGYEEAKKLLPTVANNVDRMIPVAQVREAFAKAGFEEIKFEPIGEFVFEGFDNWISQVEDKPWAHNIYKLYTQGHINYYLLELKKP